MNTIHDINNAQELNGSVKSFLVEFYEPVNKNIPLHLALIESNEIENLLKLGFPVDFKINEETLLIHCVEFNCEKNARILIEKGADINQKNKNNWDVFFIASCSKMSNEFLYYLKTGGANIDTNCFDGLNALDYSLKVDMNLNHYKYLKRLGAKSAKGNIWIIAMFLNHLIYKKTGLFKIHVSFHNKYRLDEETKQLLKPTPNI